MLSAAEPARSSQDVWGAPLLRGVLLLLLAVAAYWSVRMAWADHLSMSSELTDRERAVRWMATATIYERLANKREESVDEPLPDLERAAALDLENAERHLRVALRAELNGDLPLAESSLLRAAALSRLYQPRFLLAQYYCRRHNTEGLWRWARAALEPAYGDVTPLLNLCWRMRPDGTGLAQLAAGEKPEIARQCLGLLTFHEQTDAAYPVASRLTASARYEDLPALLGFCNMSLSQNRKREALVIWNRLCHSGLLPYQALESADRSLITNQGFTHVPLAAGFDWHVEHAPWIRTAAFGNGMRLALTGLQPEICLIAWEYVPTTPGKRYRLRFEAHSVDTPDQDGMTWVPFDLGGKPIATQLRPDKSLIFTAPAQVLRLALMYKRPLGSARLKGTVTMASVSLEAER